jgi:AhpD family alkylhydroperoxidase
MNTAMSRAEVEADIKETLGLVPHFFSAIPDELLAPEWQIFKRMELGQTLIPNKYKELIGVGLHAETKCHYCTLFHTEAAKLFGRPMRRSRKRCTTPRRAWAGARTSTACARTTTASPPSWRR